jgi:hypothetical protein
MEKKLMRNILPAIILFLASFVVGEVPNFF